MSVGGAVSGSEGEGWTGKRGNAMVGPEDEGDIKKGRRKSWSDIRRLRGRSESMPILAPREVEQLRREATEKELAGLPPNVK